MQYTGIALVNVTERMFRLDFRTGNWLCCFVSNVLDEMLPHLHLVKRWGSWISFEA